MARLSCPQPVRRPWKLRSRLPLQGRGVMSPVVDPSQVMAGQQHCLVHDNICLFPPGLFFCFLCKDCPLVLKWGQKVSLGGTNRPLHFSRLPSAVTCCMYWVPTHWQVSSFGLVLGWLGVPPKKTTVDVASRWEEKAHSFSSKYKLQSAWWKKRQGVDWECWDLTWHSRVGLNILPGFW